ncbi:MAG: 6-phosphofructokinase [Myxococcota bacterium]
MNDDDASQIRRVCILTGGGDAPGLNAVLRAFVKTAVDLGLEVYGSEDGFDGLIHAGRMVKLKPSSVRGILPRGGSILGCSNRANPFSYPTEDTQGRKELHDVSDRVVERLRGHDVDILVLVGGDGTMSMGMRFMERGVRVIGVPKTIDNDLGATDLTFGLDTAVDTATWAIDALHSTAEAHDRVMILEVMGRDAGFIALHSGMAGGADVILIPELPYDLERVVDKILRRSEQGANFSVVVVGEGAKPLGGEASTVAAGKQGHLPRLGGAGQRLAAALEQRVRHEVRTTVLGHLQRGGSPSAYDRLLGTRFGVAAARLCHRGRTGRMVALRGTQVVDVPIEDAVGHPKRVDVQDELTAAARAVGIELGR